MEFKMKTTPYNHQMEAFQKFKDRKYFGLFMDMGTGKTKVAIDIASYKYQKGEISSVLVIAPNHVHTQWATEEFPKHCPVEYSVKVWSSSETSRKYYLPMLTKYLTEKSDVMKVFCVNVEAFQSDKVLSYVAMLVKNSETFIIVDESTRIKSPKARRSKAIHKLNKYGQRAILTGTPTTKSPFDLWSQFEFLYKDYFKSSFFQFQHRYGIMMRANNHITGQVYNALIDEKRFNIVKNKINKLKKERQEQDLPTILSNRDYELLASILEVSEANVRFIERQSEFQKFKNMEELKTLIADDVYTAKKEECLDLPAKIYERVYVEMTKEQKRVYKNVKEQLRAELMDRELTVVNKLVATTRLQQICGGFFPYDDGDKTGIMPIEKTNAKLERLIEDLEEVNFENTKVIIWAAFVPELLMLNERLSKEYNCVLYYGGVPDFKRDTIKKDFVAGKYDIFIANTATGGFGLNLQNATLQYFFSNTFNVENRLQAEDRSHRIGVKSACVYKDIVVKDSIDDRIYKAIKAGRDLNDYFKTLDDILNEEE